MPATEIRPYTAEDRAVVHRIAADTAFFGAPVERFLDDRRLFLDAFYAYYTDVEPEHAWVACLDGQVVGFLTGCVDTVTHDRLWRQRILPRVAGQALRGGYRVGRRTWAYAAGLALALLRGELASADLSRYPAHLHINLEAAARGQGLGRRLIEAYLGQLRGLGAPGVHLHTTSQNAAACRLYERVGFTLLDARATRTWGSLVGERVENRCYGLLLK